MKKTAVIVAPGRGTYNREELGYLRNHHTNLSELFAGFDAYRVARSQDTVTQLDGATHFSGTKHTRGDNASPLIYACAYSDFLSIDRDQIDIVAITGNSMGWYVALACAGVLDSMGGFEVVNTMGTLMHNSLIGGQLIYPFVDDDWAPNPNRKMQLLEKVEAIDNRAEHVLSVSIELGGMLVLAGNDAGLKAFENDVPKLNERFPLRLPNHAAFHSHLQSPVAIQGRTELSRGLFRQPHIPLVDGRGYVWYPKSTSLEAIYDYTLNYQVVETYDFTTAIQTAAREFMPDLFIVLGPGNTLGGATAQSFVLANWRGIGTKVEFKTRQENEPILISMGDTAQRFSVI